MFFAGYTSFAETGIPADSLPLDWTGFNSGILYRTQHPESLEYVLTAFEYKKKTQTGVWRTGFEESRFVSSDSAASAWWLDLCADCEQGELNWKRFPKLPADAQIPNGLRKLVDDRRGAEAKVRVVGYVSPVGEYGHLGRYSRRFLATLIQPVEKIRHSYKHREGPRNSGGAYRSYHGQPHPTEGVGKASAHYQTNRR
ncbi:MAG: hypothetical protein Aurels2KO_31320 [Aureliella sp.]